MVDLPPGKPWHRLAVRDLPVEGGEPFTVVVPALAERRPLVPVDAAVGRITFAPVGVGGIRRSLPLVPGPGPQIRCFVGGHAAVRGAVGSWLSGLSPCQRGRLPCGPAGHPLVVWIDAEDADAVERSLIVLGFQLLAGITASQPAPLARTVALEWLGRTVGWVMVIEGDQGPREARWLLERFGHGMFAFSVERLPNWPGYYSGFAIEVADVIDVTGAGECREDVPYGHLAALGMGAVGEFGENAGVIGLYGSPAAEAGEPAVAGMADRLWAAGDYPRALRLQHSAVGALHVDGPDPHGERTRLENNLACLYAAMLRPKEAIAVLDACRDRLGSPGGGGVPEVLDVNLGLCHLQLADIMARWDEYRPGDDGLKASLAGIELRPENARAINEALLSAEISASRARLGAADRHREKAVEVFEALLNRHASDAESPDACFVRDCLAFCVLGAYGDYSLWPAWAAVRARNLSEENRIWHGMVSGESADVTLRSRIRCATVAGLAASEPRVRDDAAAELKQVLEIAGQKSASLAAQCALALSYLAMEQDVDLEYVAPYAVRFAEYCLQALGPEHAWSWFAAARLETIRVLVPASQRRPDIPYPPSVKVWEGPYDAKPVGHWEYPVLVPYLLAGDLLGAVSRCYVGAAARAAQREDAADFHAELRAVVERQCDRELADIARAEAGLDLSWLKAWLSDALSRGTGLLQLAGPGTALP